MPTDIRKEYELIPSADETENLLASDNEDDEDIEAQHNQPLIVEEPLDPRFNPPTPSPWTRAALVLFVLLLFVAAVSVRGNTLRRRG